MSAVRRIQKLAFIHSDPRNRVDVSVDEFNGHRFVQLERWQQGDDDRWRMIGKLGLSPKIFDELIPQLERAYERCAGRSA